MAEFVQTSIEEMLTELEQMERVGLFTKPEIRQVLQKRKAFEYKLRRRTKVKDDYLKYAQYEINLLTLVKKRRKRVGYFNKKKEIDFVIIQRVHKLFRAAVVRFQDDVTLWLTHIEFCKKQHERITASKQYTRMLQVHNKKPDLWVQAAKWDFEENKNPENARSLLQRGLRFNSDSKHLWREYYRLELLFTEKMIDRGHLVGLKGYQAEDAVLKGQVAQLVYQQAMKEFPGDIEFLMSFLHVTKLFEFTKDQVNKMYSDLELLHPDEPLTWDALAKRCLKREIQSGDPDVEFHAVYHRAVERLQSDEIWILYLKACVEILDSCPKSISALKAKVNKTLSVFAEASDAATLPDDLWQKWLDLLTDVGLLEKAEQVAELATERCPTSVLLWKRRMELSVASGATITHLNMLLKQAKVVPQKEAWPLLKLVLEFALHTDSREEGLSLLEKAMFQCREISVPAKDFFLEWQFHTTGIEQARVLYSNLSKTNPKSLQFFRNYISMESAQEKVKIKKMRTAYKDALREFGSSEPDMWLEFIQLESSHPRGQPEKAGEIYQQAIKSLTGQHNQEFIQKYTLLHTGCHV